MSTISFSGLSSGLDTSSIITQLVAASKQSENPLISEQNDLASQKSIVDNLSSAVSSLGDLANGMLLNSDVQFRTASASDSHVTVAVSGNALATTHDVRVEQTAQSQVVSSNTFTSDATTADGSVTLQLGTGSPVQISYKAGDTLDSIAAQINNSSSAGVGASVLYDGKSYRLMLTSLQTGAANAPTITDSATGGLGLGDPNNIKIPAADAKVMIDGVEVTRPTNVIDDALTGVTITAVSAQAATDPDTSVGVTLDQSAITSKLNSFVSAFNTIQTQVSNQLDYTGTTAGTNTLFGDSTLMQLQSTMDEIATSTFGGMSLADLGLTIDKTGQMSLDSTKLSSALASNPNALSDLFVKGGLSQKLSSLSDAYTAPGDGILTSKSQSFTDTSNDLQQQIDEIDQNATQLQTQLQNQFDNLESTMSQLQSQSSYISKIL